MSMTQRYAGMLRRHAAEWDKQGMPVQAECCRQAARHMETRELELRHALTVTGETLDKECGDGDQLLRLLDLDPATYRTEGGRLNLLKIRAALAERKPPNVGAEPTEEAGADWPRRDDDNDGPERPGGACRSGSARATC